MAFVRLTQEGKHWHILFNGQARPVRTRFRRTRPMTQVIEALRRDYPQDTILGPDEEPPAETSDAADLPLFASDIGR